MKEEATPIIEVEKPSPRKKQKVTSPAKSGVESETERTGAPLEEELEGGRVGERRRAVMEYWALEGRRVLDGMGIDVVVGVAGQTAWISLW